MIYMKILLTLMRPCAQNSRFSNEKNDFISILFLKIVQYNSSYVWLPLPEFLQQ